GNPGKRSSNDRSKYRNRCSNIRKHGADVGCSSEYNCNWCVNRRYRSSKHGKSSIQCRINRSSNSKCSSNSSKRRSNDGNHSADNSKRSPNNGEQRIQQQRGGACSSESSSNNCGGCPGHRKSGIGRYQRSASSSE